MSSHPPNSPHFPQLSWLDLERERRLTMVEVDLKRKTDRDLERDGKLKAQELWNKAFTLALMFVGSGLAHSKVPELLEIVRQLWRGFKP